MVATAKKKKKKKMKSLLKVLASTPWHQHLQPSFLPSCEHKPGKAIPFAVMIARCTVRITKRDFQKRALSFLTKPKNAEAGAVAPSNNSGLRLNNTKPFPSPYQKNMRDAKNAKTSKWSMTSLLVGFGVGTVLASVYFNQLVHNDIWVCTGRIESRLAELKQQSDDENQLLRHRVSVLEKELKVVKTQL